jgi:hypothetical protein
MDSYVEQWAIDAQKEILDNIAIVYSNGMPYLSIGTSSNNPDGKLIARIISKYGNLRGRLVVEPTSGGISWKA